MKRAKPLRALTERSSSCVWRHIILSVLALCGLSAFAQAITISGTVFDDGNGGTIGGTPVSTVNNTQLYIYLIDNTNTIVARNAVAAFSGAYTLSGSANANYGVALSSNNYAVNATNPNLGLPSNWVATAEGTTALGDGTPDFSVAINSSTNLTINFGIDQRPTGNSTSITTLNYDISGRVVIPYYAFTGSDPEDGTYNAGFYGRDIDLYQATGGTLYYNGNPVNFSSANTATRIPAFDYNLLRFQVSSGASHEFAYSIVDNANKVELVPNSVTLGVPLPVKLTDFSVKASGQRNLLEWEIASEKDNAGFQVERSVDGINFSTIATVDSKNKDGMSTNVTVYAYADYSAASLPATAVYYRLKQMDVSGTHEYSRIVRMGGINVYNAQLSSYPNPSAGTVSFDITTGTKADQHLAIVVLSSTGQAVYNGSIEALGGRVSTAIDLSGLAPGQYYAQIKGESVSFPIQHLVIMPH